MVLTKHPKSRSQEGLDKMSAQPCPLEICGPQLPYYRLGSNSLLGKNVTELEESLYYLIKEDEYSLSRNNTQKKKKNMGNIE